MATYRKRGDHQWQAIIRRRGYPDQTSTFNSKHEAEAWANGIEAEMSRGMFVSNREAEQTTLAEALERYWHELASKKRHPKQERNRINHWLRQSVSHRFLASLRGMDFANYRDLRRQAGRAENTIRLELALIGHLFETARKEWGMEALANPIKNIRMPSGSLERDRRLRPGEYDKLSAALRESNNPWVLPAFDLAIETSLRQGLLFKLRWDWINLHARTISIPASHRGIGNKSVPAAIPLSSKAVDTLSQLPRSIGGLVFGTKQNAALCVWNRTLARLGYKSNDLRWHDLRHEAASRFFEKGLNPMEVASVTGHKNLTTLRRYTHLQASDLAKRLG